MTSLSDTTTSAFDNAATIANYADRTRRLVPGYSDLQAMAALLLAETASEQADVLVVGAGGGSELKLFAQRHPQWRFVGVDPSKAMLDMAKVGLASDLDRVQLHEGYVDTAPQGPFDAACCLLTMHFVASADRVAMLREIRSRMKVGARFVMAHLSFPQGREEREVWLARYVAFAVSSGIDADAARRAAVAIGSTLSLVGPAQEEGMLRSAGFEEVDLFYAGLAFRGWLASA